ncbi:unnamed protein product [Ectocarpus sp. 12 AP-2014]
MRYYWFSSRKQVNTSRTSLLPHSWYSILAKTPAISPPSKLRHNGLACHVLCIALNYPVCKMLPLRLTTVTPSATCVGQRSRQAPTLTLREPTSDPLSAHATHVLTELWPMLRQDLPPRENRPSVRVSRYRRTLLTRIHSRNYGPC